MKHITKITLASSLLFTSVATIAPHAEAAKDIKQLNFYDKTQIKMIKKGTLTKIRGIELDKKVSSFDKNKFLVPNKEQLFGDPDGPGENGGFYSISSQKLYKDHVFGGIDFIGNKENIEHTVTRFAVVSSFRGGGEFNYYARNKMLKLYGKPLKSAKIASEREGYYKVDFYKNLTLIYTKLNTKKDYVAYAYIPGKTLKKHPVKWQKFIIKSLKDGNPEANLPYSYWKY